MTPDPATAWIDALIERHTQSMTRPQFLKAIRALSARYVEHRAALSDRSPLDSAGKRAAFAAFYTPLHFLTTRAVLRQLGASTAIEAIVDYGAGTGAAGAAWALERMPRPRIHAIDHNTWALTETRWNWNALGLRGRTERGDLVDALSPSTGRARRTTGAVFGWSLNELGPDARAAALEGVLTLAAQHVPVLIIEPIAVSAVPWWTDWTRRVATAGGRADEWKLEPALPAALAELDEAAGFRREHLSARTVSFNLA
jgi:hypothetical protein